jgi:hypothetical protein
MINNKYYLINSAIIIGGYSFLITKTININRRIHNIYNDKYNKIDRPDSRLKDLLHFTKIQTNKINKIYDNEGILTIKKPW